MKLKKIVITVTAIALVVGSHATNMAYAMEPQGKTSTNTNNQTVTPLWDNISDISPYISSEGTTLYPEVYIKSKSSTDSISGTMYLEKYSSGKWTSVTSWNFKGTSTVFLSKNYKGISGVTYRTRIVVTINGEKAVVTSGSCEI
ncbi:cell agglutination protein Mam3 [Lachnospiraceae bacterium 54-53]